MSQRFISVAWLREAFKHCALNLGWHQVRFPLQCAARSDRRRAPPRYTRGTRIGLRGYREQRGLQAKPVVRPCVERISGRREETPGSFGIKSCHRVDGLPCPCSCIERRLDTKVPEGALGIRKDSELSRSLSLLLSLFSSKDETWKDHHGAEPNDHNRLCCHDPSLDPS